MLGRMIPEMIVRHRLSSVAELRLGNHPLAIAVTRPGTDDFAREAQFLAKVTDVAGDDREAGPRANRHSRQKNLNFYPIR